MNIQEYYIDEIMRIAFQAKCEFAKNERERQEIKSKIIMLKRPTAQSEQMPAVLPKEEEMRKYKGKTIKKRADGRYWTRYYDNSGKQHSVYGKTQNECLNRLKEALRQNNNGNMNVTPSVLLGDWLQKWLELYKKPKVKHSTFDQMERYLREITPTILQKPLKKVTALELQTFLNGIDKPRKREKMYMFIKDAFTKAVKNKLLTDNVFDGIDKPKHDKKKSKALTREEEALFVEECKKSKQGDLFLFCLFQGTRLGEALALTYEDIDFDKKTISINKSIDTLGELTTPKTATSVRVIPLFKQTLAILPRLNSGKVFRYDRKTYQHKIVEICKKLNFEGISIHSLRHTFATRCAEAGITAKMVQHWLGHSTLDMTLNIYTHVNADFERKETFKLDTYFDTYDD